MIISDDGSVVKEPIDDLFVVRVGYYLLMTDDTNDESTMIGNTIHTFRSDPTLWERTISWWKDHPKSKGECIKDCFGSAAVKYGSYKPGVGSNIRLSLESAKRIWENQ